MNLISYARCFNRWCFGRKFESRHCTQPVWGSCLPVDSWHPLKCKPQPGFKHDFNDFSGWDDGMQFFGCWRSHAVSIWFLIRIWCGHQLAWSGTSVFKCGCIYGSLLAMQEMRKYFPVTETALGSIKKQHIFVKRKDPCTNIPWCTTKGKGSSNEKNQTFCWKNWRLKIAFKATRESWLDQVDFF